MAAEKTIPDLPYSKVVLKLCKQISITTSVEDRAQLMLQLASKFHMDNDPTDAHLTDQYHEYFDDYERARLEFQQTALRLARLAITEVEGALNGLDMPEVKSN
jgi:hypothetical protein